MANQSNALGLWNRTLRYAAKSTNLKFDDALELDDLSSQNHPEITASAQCVWRGSILLARPWCPSVQRCAAAQNSNSTTGTRYTQRTGTLTRPLEWPPLSHSVHWSFVPYRRAREPVWVQIAYGVPTAVAAARFVLHLRLDKKNPSETRLASVVPWGTRRG